MVDGETDYLCDFTSSVGIKRDKKRKQAKAFERILIGSFLELLLGYSDSDLFYIDTMRMPFFLINQKKPCTPILQITKERKKSLFS